MKKNVRTSQLFNFLSAFLAFTLWGGWAYYVNSKGPSESGLVSAITQGTASFMMTLFMVQAVTFLFHRIENPVMKVLFPAILVNFFTCLCLIQVHTLMGTPRIFYTIIPALCVAFSFCLYTSYKLLKIHQQGSGQYE